MENMENRDVRVELAEEDVLGADGLLGERHDASLVAVSSN
jgi:hypothetical protein